MTADQMRVAAIERVKDQYAEGEIDAMQMEVYIADALVAPMPDSRGHDDEINWARMLIPGGDFDLYDVNVAARAMAAAATTIALGWIILPMYF